MKWNIITPILLGMIFLVISVTGSSHFPDSITHDGLTYTPKADGYVEISDTDGLLSRKGFAVTGIINNISQIKTTEDFSWSKSYELIELNATEIWLNQTTNETYEGETIFWEKKVYTFYNNEPTFNWTIVMEFEDGKNAKDTSYITNNLGVPITNAKFWYIFEVREGRGIFYDGVWKPAWQGKTFHFTGDDLIKLKNRLDFNQYRFKYQDLIQNNFTISDVYIGNGSIIGHENKYFVGLGVTKGNGIFPDGKTITLDPEISVWYDADTTEDPFVGDWFEPDKVKIADNDRAFETTSGSIMFTSDYGINFGPNSGVEYHGMEIRVQAVSAEFFPCIIGSFGRLGIRWNVDNGTTLFSNQKQHDFGCARSGGDQTFTYGNLSDLWGGGINGLADSYEPTSDENWRIELEHLADNFGSLFVDYVEVRFNITLIEAFNITLLTPVNNSQIGADFDVLAKTNKALASCKYESNITGSFLNTTMTVIDMTNCFDNSTGMTQGNGFRYRVHFGISGGDTNMSDWMDILVNNTQPTITIHTPINNTFDTLHNTFINFTVNDTEGDEVNIDMWGYLNQSFATKDLILRLLNNNSVNFLFNFTTLPTNPSGTIFQDMIRLYHMDASSTQIDETGNQNGNLIATWEEGFGYLGSSILFDNVDDFVGIGFGVLDQFEDTCDNGCTFSMWALITSTGDLIARYDTTGNNEFFKFYQQGGVARFSIDDNGATGGGNGMCEGRKSLVAPLDAWHHYVAQFEPNGSSVGDFEEMQGVARVWIDGVNGTWTANESIGFCNPIPAEWANSEDTCLGTKCDSRTNDPLGGSLDEVVIWNRTISDIEVRDLFQLRAGYYQIIINVTDNIVSGTNPSGQNLTSKRLCDGTTVCINGRCEIPCNAWCRLDGDEIDLGGTDIDVIGGDGNATFSTNITNAGHFDRGQCFNQITSGSRLSGSV